MSASPTPTPNFGVYHAVMDDAPVFVTVDLNACEAEPDPERPIVFQVQVPLLHPLPNGLRSKEEFEAIGRLEDRLSALMTRAANGRFVGSLCGSGAMIFVFYVSEDLAEPLDLRAGWEPYALGVNTRPDPEWGFLRDVLAPSDWQRVLIAHLRLKHHMAQQGDDGERPRPVDHTAVFPNAETREAAATILRERGFEVGEPEASEDGFVLRLRRTDAIDGAFSDEVIWPVYEVVTDRGGRYVGWGAPTAQ
jgi:hypothetical protein